MAQTEVLGLKGAPSIRAPYDHRDAGMDDVGGEDQSS
jgi:hypothetical protein